MAGVTIYREGNIKQTIRYKEFENDGKVIRYPEMGPDGRRYDKKRMELMAGETIYSDEN